MSTSSIYKSAAGEQVALALYENLLANWPVPHEERTIPTRHGDAFVVISGQSDAPPLVLLHGAGSNAAIWAGDVVEYGRFFRCYAVDLLGEAGKSAPNRPAWDSPAYGEWLEDVLDGLGITRAALAGISQGGWTALKFATRCPDRVERLVLMTPGGVTPDRASFLVKAVAYSLLGKRGLTRMTRTLFGQQPVPDGVIDIVVTISQHFKPRVGTLPIFTDDDLRCLTMPVLLLGGDQDALRDMDRIAARLGALLPDLQVTILPGAGHALLDTVPHILPFLTVERAPA
jgi:pimeloyl-ACP methyl ester carboxylesterase